MSFTAVCQLIILAGHLVLFQLLATSGTLLKCEGNTNTADDEEIAIVSRDNSHKIVLYKSENLTFCDSINKCSKSGYRLPVLNTQILQEKLQGLTIANFSGDDVRVWLSVTRIDGWRYINESLTLCGESCDSLGTGSIFGATAVLTPDTYRRSYSGSRKLGYLCQLQVAYQVYKETLVTWYEAQNNCIRNDNGTLPSGTELPLNINGLQDSIYWHGLLYRPRVWVPRNDTTNLEDLTHFSYTSWNNSMFNDTLNDTCVYADINNNGKWGVERCNTTFQYYICEVEEFSSTSPGPGPDAQTSDGGVKLVYWLPVVLVLIVAVIFAVGIGLYCKKKKEKEKNGSAEDWKPQVAAVTAPATGHVNPMDVVRDEKEPEAISPYGVFDVATNSKVAPSDAADDYKPRAQSAQYAQVGANLPKAQSQNVPPSHYALAGAVPRDSVTYSEVKKAEDNDTVLVDNPQYGDLGAPQCDDTGAEPWQQNRVPPIGSADNSGNRQNDGTNDKPKPKIGKKPKNTKQETDMV